ncbi:MAG: ATP-binding protein [Candidatus Kerfeldbacteria bacterium]
MASSFIKALRSLKLRIKFFLVFFVMLLLIIDLGALNVTSISDIRTDTARISQVLIPRLIHASHTKDALNASIFSAVDYVQTGNPVNKQRYEDSLNEALMHQLEVFYLSQTQEDFQFSSDFQDQINLVAEALTQMIATFESNASEEQVQEKITIVAKARDSLTAFLEEESETKVEQEAQTERDNTDALVSQTILNVAIVGVVAIVVMLFIFIFVQRSIARPIAQLSAAAIDIGQGKFRAVEIDTKDELGLFAETFNTMTTRIKATQEALIVELEKTKKLDQQKTEFLSIAAHQLRTPMSGIKWVVSMAVEGDLGKMPEEASQQLGKGLENIDRMIILINSLLDVTKIETEAGKFKFEARDIVQITKEIESSLEPNAQEAGVTVTVHDPASPIPMAQIDVEKINIVIRNIVDNAIRYTPKDGQVSITFQQAGDYVDIFVTDTGYGIPEKEQDRIFTKFYRGTNIQTIQADGSGLGLFVAHEIVLGHDGSLTFDSIEGKGTTFTIRLPLATDQLIVQTQAADARAARGETEEPSASMKGVGAHEV